MIKHELNVLDNLITSYIKNKKLSNDVRKYNGLKHISKDNQNVNNVSEDANMG